MAVNIDETPVYQQLQPSKGNVVMLVQKLDRSCYARVPLRERRGQSTLLGCIVDTPELQSSMPQFILTNDTKLTRLEKAQMLSLPLPIGHQWLDVCWRAASVDYGDSESNSYEETQCRNIALYGLRLKSHSTCSLATLQCVGHTRMFDSGRFDVLVSTA